MNGKNVYFEDIQVGQQLPEVVQKINSRRLVMWAGAHGDFYHIHYDQQFARSTGLKDCIVHGALKHALLGRMLHEWVGSHGRVRKLFCRYKEMDYVNGTLTCKGVVQRKYQEKGRNCVELEVWTENEQRVQTTIASAMVTVPSRA